MMEPESPALAGGFFTTEPAGKPSLSFYLLTFQIMLFMPHKFAIKCATQQAARNIRYNRIQENSKLGHFAEGSRD